MGPRFFWSFSTDATASCPFRNRLLYRRAPLRSLIPTPLLSSGSERGCKGDGSCFRRGWQHSYAKQRCRQELIRIRCLPLKRGRRWAQLRYSRKLAPLTFGDSKLPSQVSWDLSHLRAAEQAITSLALIVHELATNSVKYGALSAPQGTLDVSATTHAGEKEVSIIWAERGGPPVVAPSARSGFGSRMVARAVSKGLGGDIAFDWSKEGVIVTLRIDLDCLSR